LKNKEFDRRRREAKQYAKKWHNIRHVNPDGNYLYHSYPEPKDMGWWDDVSFRLGSQVVVVAWIHPRMAFSDKTKDIAYGLLPEAPPTKWEKASTNYRRIGKNKNRKRVVSYNMTPFDGDFLAWCDLWDKTTLDIRKTTDLIIRPSIKIEQLDYCRFVSLVAPVEAIDEKSVNDMANMAKTILRGETTLEELFPEYVYTREDWASEVPDDKGK
jgi:hypothetical protein